MPYNIVNTKGKLRRPVNSHHIPWTHLIIPRNSHHILYQPCIYQVWILLYLVYIGVYRHMTVYESIYRHMTVYASICAYKIFWQNVHDPWIRTVNLMHTARLSRPLDHECWYSDCVCMVHVYCIGFRPARHLLADVGLGKLASRRAVRPPPRLPPVICSLAHLHSVMPVCCTGIWVTMQVHHDGDHSLACLDL